MTTRRWTSRSVVLTATFAALAAGGTAACDAAGDEPVEAAAPTYPVPAVTGSVAPAPPARTARSSPAPAPSRAAGEVFYCANEDGVIVEDDNCDPASTALDDGAVFLLWHSAGYPRGLRPGATLSGGDNFAADDSSSRAAYGLPSSGTVRNGTIKTNVVGKGSGSTGSGLGSGSSGG